MQGIVNAVIIVIVISSLIGVLWNFVSTPTSNETAIDPSIMTLLKLSPLFVVIGGLLAVVNLATRSKGSNDL